MLSKLFRFLAKTTSKSANRASVRVAPRARLSVERLETREVPAVFNVTTGMDFGPGSLRQAILDANTNAETPDDINIQVSGIFLQTALPAVIDGVNINGAAEGTSISRHPMAMGQFRILTLLFNGEAYSLTRLNISTGRADNGGGIYSQGILTLNDCTISDNIASGNGGGLYSEFAPVTVIGCEFFSNVAGGNGGGVYFVSGGVQPLNVTSSYFEFNRAGNSGGAISYSANGDLTVTSTDFYVNRAEGGSGGAISSACLRLTVSGGIFGSNYAYASGGAIWTVVELTASINTIAGLNTVQNPFAQDTRGAHVLLKPTASASVALVHDPFRIESF